MVEQLQLLLGNIAEDQPPIPPANFLPNLNEQVTGGGPKKVCVAQIHDDVFGRRPFQESKNVLLGLLDELMLFLIQVDQGGEDQSFAFNFPLKKSGQRNHWSLNLCQVAK
jgi:hypothetical protein